MIADVDDRPLTPDEAAQIRANAAEAATLLKAMAHDGRLSILYYLGGGERSVGELETLLGQRQAAVSQQLARLREDGLVVARVVGKSRLYAISDPRAADMVMLLRDMFCTLDRSSPF